MTNININDLTLGQVNQLKAFFGSTTASAQSDSGLCEQLGEKVIIRTYSAGVFFGTLSKKHKDEVILTDARRMWLWHAAESISLSGVAVHGIVHSKSKIAPAVSKVWLQPIEIISLSDTAIKSIESAPIVVQD